MLSAWEFKECFGLKQASDCYYELTTKKLTTIFWWYSEANEQSWSIHWILLDVFFYIQLSFSIIFMDSKVNCQIHMVTDMFKNIWKEYFIKECFWSERNILCVRFYHLAVPGCVIIACLNVIYTKFRCVMIAQLNKIWHVWAVRMRSHATHSQACYADVDGNFLKFLNHLSYYISVLYQQRSKFANFCTDRLKHVI